MTSKLCDASQPLSDISETNPWWTAHLSRACSMSTNGDFTLLRKELSTAITHCLFLVALPAVWGANGAAPASFLKWQVFPLPSVGHWSESVRASQALGGCPPEGPCHCKFPFCRLLSFLLSVCAGGRVFGCLVMEPAELGTCYLISSQPPCCYSLLTASCSSVTFKSSICPWPNRRVLSQVILPGHHRRMVGTHLRSKAAVSLGAFTPSILAVADVSTQIDLLKEDLTLQKCPWPVQMATEWCPVTGLYALLHSDRGMSLLQSGSLLLKLLLCEPPWLMCHTICPLWSWCFWLLMLPEADSVGVKGSHHHSWPHSLTASFVQVASSWQVLALPGISLAQETHPAFSVLLQNMSALLNDLKSWTHIEKFLLLIHAFPFKWSSASIIFLIFIRCENLPSLNRCLFLLFLLIFFYLLTLNRSFDHYSTIKLDLSDYYIVIISCDGIQYCDPCNNFCVTKLSCMIT